MGFLSWLFRRRPELPIQAWLDEDARRAGLVRAVQSDLASGLHVVVVAHFVDELVACGQALTAAGVPFVTLRQWTDVDAKAALSAPGVAVVLAKTLPRTPDAASAGAKPGPVRVRVHAAEMHVLADANRRVLDFAHALPAPAEAVGHASLTGPQLASFMTPTMREMMARLGMTADAPIDSPMVGRAVRNALAKLAAAATSDRDASSLAQWLERNVPPQR